MNTFFRVLGLLGLLWASQATFAIEVEGLYEAEVPATSQDPAQRPDLMKAALAAVLVKVSGNRAILEQPRVAELMSNAPQYVQQFVYRNAAVTNGQRAAQPPQRVLWVRFDRDVLNRVLRQAGIGIWGKARPALMLWLDLVEAGQHVVLGLTSRPEWKQFVDQISTARGVVVTLPAMDAQDSAAMMSADLWSGTYDDIKRVSSRYPSEAIIVGRVEPVGAQFTGSWALYEHDGQRSWSSQAESRDAAVLDGLQNAIDAVSERYTTSGTGGGSLLHVTDVRSLEDYARIDKYLSSLAAVDRVELLRIEGNTMLFRVEAQGGVARLADDIRLGNTLVAEPVEGVAAGEQDAAIRFRLQR